MLPKKNRADKKVVARIFKEGKLTHSPSLTFKFILNKTSRTPRISFIVPKGISKLAVRRNLLRRKGYTALKKYMHQSPLGLFGVFVFKKYQDNVSILEKEIKNTFDKIH